LGRCARGRRAHGGVGQALRSRAGRRAVLRLRRARPPGRRPLAQEARPLRHHAARAGSAPRRRGQGRPPGRHTRVQCVLVRARGADRRRAPLSREPSRVHALRRARGAGRRGGGAGGLFALSTARARHRRLVCRALHTPGSRVTRRGRRKRPPGVEPENSPPGPEVVSDSEPAPIPEPEPIAPVAPTPEVASEPQAPEPPALAPAPDFDWNLEAPIEPALEKAPAFDAVPPSEAAPAAEPAPTSTPRRLPPWLARMRPLLTTIAVAVAAFFTGLYLFNEVVMPRWVHRGTETRVPDLQNLNMRQAASVLDPLGLRLSVRGEQYDPDV